MQEDNRGTVASLTTQIGLPRPFRIWALREAPGRRPGMRTAGNGALPCKSQVAEWSWRADLGRQGGYCAAVILLHALIIPLSFPYFLKNKT